MIALLLALAPLSGCLGGGEEAVEPTSDGVNATDADASELEATGQAEEATDPGASPSWTHGDWWTYDVSFDLGFGELLSGETTLVLHDTQDTYDVAAADRNAAIVDQHFDTFFVGSLDQDLNPTSGFQMFDFPLTDGKSWTTEVDTVNGSAEVELTATATSVDLPTGSEEGFQIHGADEEAGIEVRYTYAPSVQWVTHFEMHAPDFEGQQREVLTMDLVEQGASYEGSFVVLDMEELYFDEVFGAPIGPDPGTSRAATVQVDEGFTFVQRVVVLFNFDVLAPTSGTNRVDLFSPEDDQYTYEQTGAGELVEIAIDEPPIAGEWRVAYENVGTNVAVVGFFGFDEQVVEFTSEDHAHHE